LSWVYLASISIGIWEEKKRERLEEKVIAFDAKNNDCTKETGMNTFGRRNQKID
jgi:hypothetical protein